MTRPKLRPGRPIPKKCIEVVIIVRGRSFRRSLRRPGGAHGITDLKLIRRDGRSGRQQIRPSRERIRRGGFARTLFQAGRLPSQFDVRVASGDAQLLHPLANVRALMSAGSRLRTTRGRCRRRQRPPVPRILLHVRQHVRQPVVRDQAPLERLRPKRALRGGLDQLDHAGDARLEEADHGEEGLVGLDGGEVAGVGEHGLAEVDLFGEGR
mmetsp:Transcript_57860/g.122753  ORF Transcript_57860/g.122753 Transcript_57860/m.122753 type:complete len:210 (+) Transcript_57860:367-996(+)